MIHNITIFLIPKLKILLIWAKIAIVSIYLIGLLKNNIFVLIHRCIIAPFYSRWEKTRLDAQAECEFLIATTIGKILTHIPSLVRIISNILHSCAFYQIFKVAFW